MFIQICMWRYVCLYTQLFRECNKPEHEGFSAGIPIAGNLYVVSKPTFLFSLSSATKLRCGPLIMRRHYLCDVSGTSMVRCTYIRNNLCIYPFYILTLACQSRTSLINFWWSCMHVCCLLILMFHSSSSLWKLCSFSWDLYGSNSRNSRYCTCSHNVWDL